MNFVQAITLAIISNMIWGTTFLTSKFLIHSLPPTSILTFRFLIASISLFLFGFFKKINFQVSLFIANFWSFLILTFISYVLMYWFQLESLKYISSSLNAGIMLLAPVFTSMISLATNSKATKKHFLTVFVSLVGALLILKPNGDINTISEDYLGIFYALISSFCLGSSVNLTKFFFSKSAISSISAFNLTFYSMTLSAFAFLLISLFLNQSLNLYDMSCSISLALLYLGLICSVFAFLIWNISIKYLSAPTTALTMYIKTPIAYFLGFVFLSEKLDPNFYLGTLIIIFALSKNFITNSKEG